MGSCIATEVEGPDKAHPHCLELSLDNVGLANIKLCAESKTDLRRCVFSLYLHSIQLFLSVSYHICSWVANINLVNMRRVKVHLDL
jgi:hypothetical protein